MSKTYKTTGINLNGIPMGENDRLMTILTPEYGLIRAIAPGARKYKSSLRGRSELFVVNELLLVKGRNLDRITQAETQESYPKLSQNLAKLIISQYLAELVLYLAVSQQPQTELYSLLTEHLTRIEKILPHQNILPYLTQGIFHILVIAGIAPQVHNCCLTQKSLIANFKDPDWQVGFSFNSGGFMILSEGISNKNINHRLSALELTLFQNLHKKTVPDYNQIFPEKISNLSIENSWIKIEKVLKNYVEFHLGRCLKSAKMIHNLLNKT